MGVTRMTDKEAKTILVNLTYLFGDEEVLEALDVAISALSATKDCTDFLCWLLEEIMDEENWEMNAEADGEIIARKLKKLGLLESKDGYYVRTPMYEALATEPSDLMSHKEAWAEIESDRPTENTNTPINTPTDLISRADAKKAICKACLNGESIMRCKHKWNCPYLMELCEAPSVSAKTYDDGYVDGICEERPIAYKIGYNDGYERGKAESVSAERVGVWVDVNKDGSLWECNKCHEKVCCSGNNYCPNCGAKMKGGNE